MISKNRMDIGLLINFVEENVESPINIGVLSSLLQCSDSQLHRVVNQCTGMTPAKLIELLRVHRGCYLLHYRNAMRCTDVAILCGYDSSDSFRRAFKRVTGYPPSQFQRQHIRIDTLPYMKVLSELQPLIDDEHSQACHPTIMCLPAVPVYAMTHTGHPAHIPVTVGAFIRWRKQHKLSPTTSRTFNAFWQDSANIGSDFRIDIMCEAVRPVQITKGSNVFKSELPAGRYAVIDSAGGDHVIQQSAHALINNFIPDSKEEAADYPLIVQRIRFYPDVPLNQALNRVMVLLK